MMQSRPGGKSSPDFRFSFVMLEKEANIAIDRSCQFPSLLLILNSWQI